MMKQPKKKKKTKLRLKKCGEVGEGRKEEVARVGKSL
jgi:hypothetical protein